MQFYFIDTNWIQLNLCLPLFAAQKQNECTLFELALNKVYFYIIFLSVLIISFKQDSIRSIRFYFLPFTASPFIGYANIISQSRSCSCGDRAVTHAHKKTIITLHLRIRVNYKLTNIVAKLWTKFIEVWTSDFNHEPSSNYFYCWLAWSWHCKCAKIVWHDVQCEHSMITQFSYFNYYYTNYYKCLE